MSEQDNKYNFVGKIDLEVDKDRYLIGNIRWKDVIITSPFMAFGAIMCVILSKYLHIKIGAGIGFLLYALALSPAIAMWIIVTMVAEEYDRSKIKVINKIFYLRDFRKRKKTFGYSNEKIERKSDFVEDIRSKFGIYDISRECYEKLDDEIAKVIRVSSINVTSLPKSDQRKVYRGFEEFNNKLDFRVFPIQITNKTTPISLDKYIEECKEIFNASESKADRLFGESYLKFASEIQKDKKMVSKSPYIVIKRKKRNNEDTYAVLEEVAERLVSQIENMLPSQYSLSAEILNNEDLFELLHYSIDYQNANTLDINNISNNSFVTFSDKDNEAFEQYWKERESKTIT
ncbi:hypothetical protein [Staphylococcus epidermidis]|uniref:hypothetical protein n=1 Tax=Staphylococcus epidermidis TaxID=1282 RepID=UPI0034D60AC7